MSSLTRMLAVLDAFSAQHPVLTAEDLMASLGYSRGTAYRYVRELMASGLLTRVQGAGFTLGPRIIELDHAIREVDPVLSAATPVMQGLSSKFQCDVLLTAFYEDRVVVTHHERGDDAIIVSYGRGRRMPLFKGAPSKAILAALPAPTQNKIHAAHKAEIAAAGLGLSREAFRSALAAIRREGYCVSLAELDAGNVGVAVPLANDTFSGRGSLALVIRRALYEVMDKNLMIESLKEAAARIEASSGPARVARPAPAAAEPAPAAERKRRRAT